MDDVIARLWQTIDDLEFWRASLERDFERSKQNHEKNIKACDEKIRRHLKELEEILRKES